MPKILRITNQRFGRLVALQPVGKNVRNHILWQCKCDCGNSYITSAYNLRRGHTVSCGCRKYLHGHCTREERHPLYSTWQNIHHRCNAPTGRDYKNYGGRGITVCARWCDFVNFLTDITTSIGERPPQHVLDRIDNDGNYEPGNMRWANYSVSNRNRRHFRKHSVRGPYGSFVKRVEVGH